MERNREIKPEIFSEIPYPDISRMMKSYNHPSGNCPLLSIENKSHVCGAKPFNIRIFYTNTIDALHLTNYCMADYENCVFYPKKPRETEFKE